MAAIDDLHGLLARVEARAARVDMYRRAWLGEAPAAFMSQKSREALDGRLKRLSVGYPRLVVNSQVDRLRVTGFRRAGAESADAQLWDLWRRAGLIATSELVHTDRSLYGQAYVTTWADDSGRPVVTPSGASTTAVDVDPGTGVVRAAARRWNTRTTTEAVLWEPDRAVRFRLPAPDMPAGAAWERVDTIENPFGVVPVTPFIRASQIGDVEGTSAVADILDLSDAVAKALQDLMVTSEFAARPRRWATGLEIVEDEDGNPVDPFGEGRFLQSEAPETKFGQLEPSRLDGYGDMIATLTQQIGALTGLPPHYLGLNGDQPPSAESIRASETQLTSAAYSEQRQLDPSWARVASLLAAVASGSAPVDPGDITTLWQSPEVRTPAQAADAAAKLAGIGVPLSALLADPLGFDPQAAAKITAGAREAAFLGALGSGR